MKYFYIITRDGQIFEIEFTEERFKSSLEQWQKGGLIFFPSLGVGINAVDITKIMNEEQYKGYVDSAKPKLFIKNGTWYDFNERKPVRHEVWKQKEIDERIKLEPKEDYGKPFKFDPKQFRPEFVQDWYTKMGKK